MKIKALIAIGAMALLGCVGARAAPVSYEGGLGPFVPVTGTVGGFSYFLDDGPNVDFWMLSLIAGTTYTVTGTRLNNNLDPAFDLYFGTTTADVGDFAAGTSWGGMTLIGSADDELPSMGPFGDPQLIFVAPVTGLYTVAIGGALSTDAGPYPYQLALVPEPATMLLLVPGLIGVAWTRRTRRR